MFFGVFSLSDAHEALLVALCQGYGTSACVFGPSGCRYCTQNSVYFVKCQCLWEDEVVYDRPGWWMG